MAAIEVFLRPEKLIVFVPRIIVAPA